MEAQLHSKTKKKANGLSPILINFNLLIYSYLCIRGIFKGW
ncbi:hypothetical protein J3R74_001338 [Puniceicoccus vermicola]